jgi:carbamoyl-phosphate synthase small subunit
MAFNPHGVFLSNGPGDPSAMTYTHPMIKKVVNDGTPVFGICLGHQLLALSQGIETYKMHHGHRGINHPVFNVETGKGEITSQNHGFGVSPEALAAKKESITVTHVNLNDQTVEGLRINGKPAFSVQYHPESSPGPHDSRYLFDEFVSAMSDRNS